MAAIKGRGVVWSVGAITYAGAIVLPDASSSGFTQSLGFARTSESTMIKDNQGIIRSMIYHGFKKTLSITVVPASLAVGAGAIANAVLASTILNPQAGGTVTITDDSGTVVDGPFNLISTKQNRTVDGGVTVDLEMEAGDEGIDTTTLVT